MVTKGLDFDNVYLVGILDADMLLNRPDFRAYERSYQLMSQVAGRAGRQGKQGRVIKILIKGRSGEQGSLTQAMRAALLENLDLKGNDHLGLAGVFRILKGKIKSHVQPDYVDIKHEYYDSKLMKCVKDFLQFYQPVGSELQCYSVLWTGDPTGGSMNLRESSEHTHFHSYKNKQEAGHYHCDVTPDEIEYECYFNTADEIYRVNNIYKELASQS